MHYYEELWLGLATTTVKIKQTLMQSSHCTRKFI